MTLAELVTGGIPPDEDHKALMVCSFIGCEVRAEDSPLVVVAVAGKMAVLCPEHYRICAESP